MFVRWKNRPHQDRHEWHQQVDLTYSAYLVKSVRIDGKPRQKVITFLSSTRRFKLDCPYTSGEEKARRNRAARYDFWERVEAHLAYVELTEEQREAIYGQLALVVPPLSDDEQAAHKAYRREEAERAAQIGAQVNQRYTLYCPCCRKTCVHPPQVPAHSVPPPRTQGAS